MKKLLGVLLASLFVCSVAHAAPTDVNLVPLKRISSYGQETVTTSGTEVQLVASSTPCSSIVIKALSTNTGSIAIGSNSSVTVSNGFLLVASDSGNVTVSFTIEQALTSDGKIKVTFPTSLGSGFTMNSGGSTAAGTLVGLDGTLSVAVASNVLTMTRGGGATATALGTACSFVLSNIQNPTTAGSTGTYKIETYTTADVLIDDDLAVTSDTITSPPSGTNPFKISGCRLVGVKVS